MLKRVFDVLASLIALVVLGPALLLLAFLVFLHDRGAPFYLQQRIGLDGKPF